LNKPLEDCSSKSAYAIFYDQDPIAQIASPFIAVRTTIVGTNTIIGLVFHSLLSIAAATTLVQINTTSIFFLKPSPILLALQLSNTSTVITKTFTQFDSYLKPGKTPST